MTFDLQIWRAGSRPDLKVKVIGQTSRSQNMLIFGY